ncbi:hypothetical protein [Thermococcus sp.]
MGVKLTSITVVFTLSPVIGFTTSFWASAIDMLILGYIFLYLLLNFGLEVRMGVIYQSADHSRFQSLSVLRNPLKQRTL